MVTASTLTKEYGGKHTMAEDTTAVAEEVKQPTEKELKAELQKALNSGDFKEVSKVSRKIDQLVRSSEKAEQEAKMESLKKVEDRVKAAITKAVQPIIDSKALDAADGIWFAHDFGEQAPTLRLTKTAPRKSGGGGGGKKFDISTNDMLAKFGDKQYKETGLTIKQAYEGSQDKNYRFAIRQTLLKLEGVI